MSDKSETFQGLIVNLDNLKLRKVGDICAAFHKEYFGEQRERGVHKLLIHGEVDNFIINKDPYSAKQVAKMMLQAGFKKGTPIECISCSTGMYADGAAYQLGRYLKSPVIAPSNWVRAVDVNTYVIKD
ncbi:hypothetical protein [Flavobacterium ajazii]|uniref:hypothetical protein n=1 Tax=Flavobacterium ajazii TaxID=2692318 RepID=UPI0013D77E61|nr:hypothetical protein [Flavobacterium ajazii]